jgi:hypothetical protein
MLLHSSHLLLKTARPNRLIPCSEEVSWLSFRIRTIVHVRLVVGYGSTGDDFAAGNPEYVRVILFRS